MDLSRAKVLVLPKYLFTSLPPTLRLGVSGRKPAGRTGGPIPLLLIRLYACEEPIVFFLDGGRSRSVSAQRTRRRCMQRKHAEFDSHCVH